ncbi:MAG: AAA family ATPase [Gammaproteobacteria bacterium]
MKSLIIYYGQMGMGKTFAAKVLADKKNITYLNCDQLISSLSEVPLTNAGVDKLVRQKIIPAIEKLLENNDVVADYAFYKREHRTLIREYFKNKTTVSFVNVACSDEQQAENLKQRKCGRLFWRPFSRISYKMAPYEGPNPEDKEEKPIFHTNSGVDELISQMEKHTYYKSLPDRLVMLSKEEKVNESKGTEYHELDASIAELPRASM